MTQQWSHLLICPGLKLGNHAHLRSVWALVECRRCQGLAALLVTAGTPCSHRHALAHQQVHVVHVPSSMLHDLGARIALWPRGS